MLNIWDWIKKRFGLEEIWNALFARKIPEATGPIAWLYTLGSACLFVFILQVITGALLAMNYVPSPDHAYDSIRFIEDQVIMGRIIRGLHHWGASFMVVLVALHLMRVYFGGAYKYPREATWMVGMILFLLVMGFSFTGYLLPWDQKAYWATMVGTSIAGQSPVLGPYLAKILKGADEMGAITLTRFFAIHTLILGALTLIVIAIHLFLVIWHGISEPPFQANPPLDQKDYSEKYKKLKAEGKSFFPYAVSKDTIISFLILIVLCFLAWYKGAGLEDPADPTDSSYNPRPEWYFLFLFQALKLFPGKLETIAAVILPGIAVAFLMLLPFIDRGFERRPQKRPFFILLAVGTIITIGILTYRGAVSPLTNPIVEKNPVIFAGQRLYISLNCTYCHRISGKGGVLGPELDKVAARSEEWLEKHFREPQSVSPGSIMPKLNLLDDEIKALVAYMLSLSIHEDFTADATKIFSDNCSGCHILGKEGGEVGPNLSLIGSARDKNFIKRYIEDPSKANPSSSMPGYKGQLTDTQIEDLARYLASQKG